MNPILCQSEEKVVGTTGFEPATSRTPSVRATRLRYVPTGREPRTAQLRSIGCYLQRQVAVAYHSVSSSVKKARSSSRSSINTWRLMAPADSAGR